MFFKNAAAQSLGTAESSDLVNRFDNTPPFAAITGCDGQSPSKGLLERHGEVQTIVVEPASKASRRKINAHFEAGSMVYTDALEVVQRSELRLYAQRDQPAERCVVGVHTNGTEDFWTLLKRTIGGR